MKPILEKLKEENKKKIIYSRIVTNRMTIVAWRLWKQDHKVHLGFLCYRLRRDFGFTWWEVANFTGIPVAELKQMYHKIKPLLDSSVLKILAEMDEEGALKEWRELSMGDRQQGLYVIHDYPAWYLRTKRAKRYSTEPEIKLGTESEKDYTKREVKNGKD